MRKFFGLLVVLILIGGLLFLASSRGWISSSWLGPLRWSSADVATTSKVKAALGLSKRVSDFKIDVSTDDGVVTLRGEVPSEDAKSLAGEIARDTEGVKEVLNEIAVNPGAQHSGETSRVEDLEIRGNILQAFARSPELGGKNIEVKVENRAVTLSGAVETVAQRNGAEQTARAVDGVVSVINQLAVTSPEAPADPSANRSAVDPNEDLAKRVKFELYDTGAFETLTMTVRAEDGTVTLSGKVRSRAEQLLAERVAQGTPGVKKVLNELQVAAAPARR